jgi:GH15 family glucan-1,4-alpha-glucosidase
VSIGLAAAASLARMTGHAADAARWDEAAARLRHATLTDAVYGLVHEGQLIKRRRLDGSVQARIDPLPDARLPASVPLAAPGPHWLNPDTCTVLPIAFGFVDASSPLAAATLRSVELLWNQDWRDGGYGRYHVSSEPDSPGGWPFASIFVARAAIDAGQPDRAWRVLRWLDTVPGAAAGSWFEYYGPRAAPPFPQVGVIPWTWSEMLALFVHHILGVHLDERHVRVRPRLLPGLDRVTASIPIRDGRLELGIERSKDAGTPVARVRQGSARPSETPAGEVTLPYGAAHLSVDIVLPGSQSHGS